MLMIRALCNYATLYATDTTHHDQKYSAINIIFPTFQTHSRRASPFTFSPWGRAQAVQDINAYEHKQYKTSTSRTSEITFELGKRHLIFLDRVLLLPRLLFPFLRRWPLRAAPVRTLLLLLLLGARRRTLPLPLLRVRFLLLDHRLRVLLLHLLDAFAERVFQVFAVRCTRPCDSLNFPHIKDRFNNVDLDARTSSYVEASDTLPLSQILIPAIATFLVH